MGDRLDGGSGALIKAPKYTPREVEKSALDNRVPDGVGWVLLAAAFAFLMFMYDAGFRSSVFVGCLASLAWLGLLGLGTPRVRSYLIYGLGAIPVIFGLSLLFIISRTETPEEIRSGQVLTEIKAQELELYDFLTGYDLDGSAQYEEIAREQAEIDATDQRATAIWHGIPEGTVIMRNKVPVGEYRRVVELRDGARSAQARLDTRKRALALDRAELISDPTVERMMEQQAALTMEREVLSAEISEFEQSAPGRTRTFAQFVMIGLVVLGVILFFAFILSS